MFKRLCVLTDVDPDLSLTPHRTVISVGPWACSASRHLGLDAPSFSIKAPGNESCRTKHFSLLLSAASKLRYRQLLETRPAPCVRTFRASGSLLGEQHREGNQSVTAEGSTACGDSSSSLVTKRNRNQMEKIKCLCQTGGMTRCLTAAVNQLYSAVIKTDAKLRPLRS